MADSSDSWGERTGKTVNPRASTERPSVAKIKAVADRLDEQRERIDRPAKPTTIDLGEISRSILDAAQRSSASPSLSPNVGGLSIPGDSTPFRLPADRWEKGSGGIEPNHEDKPGRTQAHGSLPSASVGPNSVGRSAVAASSDEKQVGPSSTFRPSPSVPISKARSDGPTGEVESASRSRVESDVSTLHTAAQPANPFESARRFPSHVPLAISPGPAAPNISASVGVAAPAKVGQSAKAPNPIAPDISSKPPSIPVRQGIGGQQETSGPQAQVEVRSPISRATPSGPMSDRANVPSNSAGPATNFVRNPMSTDLRDLSSSSPAHSGPAGSAAEQGGMGRGAGDFAAAGSSSSQGGNTVDLSKTNELLQQLIDAVRKQQDSSLPIGGRSVYPER